MNFFLKKNVSNLFLKYTFLPFPKVRIGLKNAKFQVSQDLNKISFFVKIRIGLKKAKFLAQMHF